MSTNEAEPASADVAVIVGRWQILQRGHCALLRAALKSAPKVVVVIGSAWHSRDARNPFTWQERQQQFESVLTPAERARVAFVPVRDYADDERWSEAVRDGVAKHTAHGDGIALLGFRKGETSGPREDFPNWSLIEIEPVLDVSSTELRRMYFESDDPRTALAMIGGHVEPAVMAYLEAFAGLAAYRQCAAEHRAVEVHRKKYTSPFQLTANCVLTAGHHVLLILRGGQIGTGLWALPGGFIELHETFYEAAVRELAEETGFSAPALRMKRALRAQAVFDHPFRSARGRVVNTTFHFHLGDDARLPQVRGDDDAREARWVPIAELPAMEEQIFEDHAVILDHFLHLWPPH